MIWRWRRLTLRTRHEKDGKYDEQVLFANDQAESAVYCITGDLRISPNDFSVQEPPERVLFASGRNAAARVSLQRGLLQRFVRRPR